MPGPTEDGVLLLKSIAAVAGLAVPVSLACVVWLKRQRVPLSPKWQKPSFCWPGSAILLAMMGSIVVLPAVAMLFAQQVRLFDFLADDLEPYQVGRFTPRVGVGNAEEWRQIASQLRAMWTNAVLVPVLLFVSIALRALLGRPVSLSAELQQLPRTILWATVSWLTFGVAAYALNVLLSMLFTQMNWPLHEHPLTRLGRNGDGTGGVLFLWSACVCAPMLEEFLFRGMLIPWLMVNRSRTGLLQLMSVALTVLLAWPVRNDAAMAFACVLLVFQFILFRRHGRHPIERVQHQDRGTAAIWASASLFAMIHATVWPSPMPLFILALGLGYLRVRFDSWVPCAVTHGLFNLVSTLFVFWRHP